MKGIIDKRKLQEAMRAKEFLEGFIEVIDKHAKRVKLTDFKNRKFLEVTGDGIADDVHEGDRIYA